MGKVVTRIGAFYRSPEHGSDIDRLIVEEINRGCCNNTIILGDFNLPGVNWKCLEGGSSQGDLFIDCFQDNFLEQWVDKPTRGDKILDLVLSNWNVMEDLEVKESLGDSDHAIIQFSIGVEMEGRVNNQVIPNFAKGDFIKLRHSLSLVNWEGEFQGLDAFEMWEKFKGILTVCQNQAIPNKIVRGRKLNPPWWSSEIRAHLKSKKGAFRRLKECGGFDNLVRYRSCRNSLKRIIRQSKRLAEIKLAESSRNDPKKFFSFYRFMDKGSKGIGPIHYKGLEIVSDEGIAEAFKDYFSTVFTSEEGDIEFSNGVSVCHVDSLRDITFTVEEIKGLLCGLKPNKSAGPDGIHGRILREGQDYLAVALQIIFSRSFEYCEIPDDWKDANVVPIFKKGNKSEVENYRPISLTSNVVKVMEKIIKGRIHEFLRNNNLISDDQHGFREGRSCLSNLLLFLDYVTGVVDSGKGVDVVYLDLSKAFDKVPHRKLLFKLSMHGISGGVTRWIDGWLTSRRQRVLLNGFSSKWDRVRSGVPQGSVLGPLLFIIFVNDLGVNIGSKIFKFADDTKLVRPICGVNDSIEIQRDLDRLMAWAGKWGMSFNVSKCKVLHVGRSGNDGFGYEMGKDWVEEVSVERDLGVFVTSDLKSGKQCLEARNRANRMLGIINRNVSYKSKRVIRKLYNSYVRPHLEYCVQAWSPHFRYDINLLERVQRRATKLVPGLRDLDYETRLRELGMYSLERRRIRGDLIEVFKIMNGMVDIDVGVLFTLDINSRTRGHSRKIKKNACNLDVRKFFFGNRIVDRWNELPEQVVGSANVNTFKVRLDEFMDSMGIM